LSTSFAFGNASFQVDRPRPIPTTIGERSAAIGNHSTEVLFSVNRNVLETCTKKKHPGGRPRAYSRTDSRS
jgi:hypothetical protein